MQTAIPCSLYRGGTSKGLFFMAGDLPQAPAVRDAVLLAMMGSPDPRQIDGLGGADPLTSKVAVVSRSTRPDADLDFLFLQVFVDQALVSDSQNCGNILSAVAPFALESGLLEPAAPATRVRIHMRNTGTLAVATIQTPDGRVTYDGDCRIDGVPGAGAAIPLEFLDLAGSTCGALLPTGAAVDVFDGLRATCIDNGMPVVIVRAEDLGVRGDEAPETLEANVELKARVERLRLLAGAAMGLGDVASKSTPKVSLVSPPSRGGAISTRTFIPHRVHKTIGVFGAVSVATAACVPGSVACEVAVLSARAGRMDLDVEHPAGALTVRMAVEIEGAAVVIREAAFLRTARRLMTGEAYVSSAIWSGR